MYSVSDTTRAWADSLAPVELKLRLSNGEDSSAGVTSCTMTQRCCAGDHFTVGNACSGSLRLTLDSAGALGLQGRLVRLLWSVNEAFYPLFTGYVTRERVVNGALELEVNDALYCFGSTAFDFSTGSWTGAVNYIAGVLGVGLSETLAQPGKDAIDLSDLSANATCAQVLAMLAGLAGGNAFIDREGLLTIRAYAETDFSAECYEDGETVEGASFATSGLKFIRPSEDENGGYLELAYSAGDGALALENPLADQSHTDYAWSKISTLNFYAGDFTIPGGLLLEPCDLITVNGNPAAVMELTMTIDGGVKTDIASYGGEDTGGASGSLTSRVDALKERMESIQKQVTTEKTAREEAVEDLNKALADASGLYASSEAQSDGSTIWYLHDQAALTASTLVVKITNEGIGVSNDGGVSFASGFTFDGDAIVRILSAEGVNADWITAGVLQSPDGGKTFYLNLDTGELRLAPGGSDVVTGVAVTSVAVLYASNSSSTTAPTSGWSETAPAWVDGQYIWSKTVTTLSDGTQTETDPTCLTGATGESAVTCRIDSSGGYSLRDGDAVTLTARIFDGSTEVDPDGAYFYLWYASTDGEGYTAVAAGKTLMVSEAAYEAMVDLYFLCTDKHPGITPVEYIETTGAEYIDTGVKADQDTRLVSEFMYLGGNGVYGARSSVSSNNFSMRVIANAWQLGYGDGVASGTIAADNEWHRVDHNKNALYIDGALAVEREYEEFTTPKTIGIGAIIAGSIYYGLGRYKSCRIWDNGTMVRDLIACVNVDGEVGMYDILNGVFYSNAGGGTLTPGPVLTGLT